MFKGLGSLKMEPFSFTFANGIVTGPNFSFSLLPWVCTYAPEHLIHFVYEAWNKQFNPQCIISGAERSLGVEWNGACLMQTGTPNLLTAAGLAIIPAIVSWAKAYRMANCPDTSSGTGTPTGTTTPGTSTPTGGGSGTTTMPGVTSSQADPGFFSSLGNIGIIAAVAVVALLILKR